MFDLSYPARADALARRVDYLAHEIVRREQHLARAAGESGWSGPAAEAFHRSAHESMLRVRVTIECLERAADAIRRHVQACEQTLERRPR